MSQTESFWRPFSFPRTMVSPSNDNHNLNSNWSPKILSRENKLIISRLILDPFHVFTWLDFTSDKKYCFFTAGNNFCFICIVSFFVAGVKYPALVELRGSAPKCPLKPRVAPGWRQFYQQVGQLFLPNVWGGRQWASVQKIHHANFWNTNKNTKLSSYVASKKWRYGKFAKSWIFPPDVC